MDHLGQDIRYALRTCWRAPGFTAIAVLALALGIGANTAIFTIVNAVLIERLPFRDPDRLVMLWEESSRRPGRSNVVAPANFLRWRERATAFEGMAAFADTRVILTGDGPAEELVAQLSIGDLLLVFGVRPVLGRVFTEQELTTAGQAAQPGDTAPVTVLSHELWQRRFGADPAVLGKVIHLNGRPIEVVGVMPPDVRLMTPNSLVGRPTDLWMPYPLPESARTPRGRSISVIARLKPDIALEQARTQMNAIAASLSIELPQFDTGWKVRVIPLREDLAGKVRPALLVLAGAVAFVLLIACANVANLLLARGAARQREIAIRGALGAPRHRVVSQLLTESLVLGVLGGAAGLIVARWSLDAMLAMSPIDLTGLGHVDLSWPVLGFTAAVALLTAIVCGFAPAFDSAHVDVHESLKEGGRQVGGSVRHRRLRQAFVISEVALSVVLMVGAGLMLRSFGTLRAVNPGIDVHNVLTARVSLPALKYDTPDKTMRFFDRAAQNIAALPGVESVGRISYLPFTGLGAGTGFTIVGQPPPEPGGRALATSVSVCDNGYFATMRMSLLQGRLFSDREMHEKSNVVIVNDTFARRYFPGEDPLGKQVVISMTDPNVPTTIIGVVGDAKFTDLRAAVEPTSFWPHPQLTYTAMTLTIRTKVDPASVAGLIASQVQAVDPDQPLSDVRTMEQWMGRTLAQARFNSLLLGIFASLALLLASIGIYGVISYSVTQRTSEFGIRLALGAERGDILRMVVGSGLRLAAVGLGVGIVLALALSRTITTLLYQTRGTDPLTFAAVVALLGGVALFASYLPARRATRVPPGEALRAQ